MATQLQGDPYNLQGNTQPLQGAAVPLQGSGMPVAATVAPVVQNQAVAAPQAAPAVTDLSGKYANVGGTIYDKATGQGFSTPQQFFQAAGVNSFNGLKYDTAWTPSQVQQPAQQQNGAVPAGWDAQTYANFKAANPTLEPTANDTARMQAAGSDPYKNLATNAGLSGASTDDFLKMLGSQTAITPQERASIYQQLGIPDLAASAFAAPSQSTTQVLNDAYSAASLSDVKQQIMTLNDQINKARTDLTTATGSVNENPWLSEASRVGRLGTLQSQAQSTIGNLIDQQTQYKDLYAQGLNDINGMVTRHTTDFTTNQTLNAQKLTYLVQQAEGISTATQAQKTAQLARYMPDYLAAKTQAATPATVQFPNGASYSYDKTTGQWHQPPQPQAPFASTLGPDGLPTSFNPNTGTYGVSTTPVSGLTTPAAVNNNPGNLKNPDGSWQTFATPQAGFQALMNDVQVKQSGNSTHAIPDGPNAGQKLTASSSLTDMMRIYAPTKDHNDPVSYANIVAKNLGISADTAIGQIPTDALSAQIAQHEDGTYWNAINKAQSQPGASTTANLPPLVQKYAESLSSVQGSEYINSDRIPSAQADAIKIQAAGSKVPDR